MMGLRLAQALAGGAPLAARLLAYFGYLFLIVPSLIVIPLSFSASDEFVFPPQDWSFRLYEAFFFESNWLATAWASLKVALGTMALSLLLGVPAAYGLARGSFPGRSLLLLLLLSPMFVPTIVLALSLYLTLSHLQATGTLPGLIASHTLIALPFVIVSVLAGLRHVDADLEKAAGIMGAGPVRAFLKVTLPLIRPSVVAAGLFAFLISFDEVVISYFITQAQSPTLPVRMYSSIKWEISPVLSAISTLLTMLSLLICLVVAFGGGQRQTQG